MVKKTTKEELKRLVNRIRTYCSRLLDGLNENELQWRYESEKGKSGSIRGALRHIINAEIYWLKDLGIETMDYAPYNASFTDLKKIFQDLKPFLLNLIEKISEEDLILKAPGSKDGETITQKFSLSWVLWRTSLHAVHHMAQVAYIRKCLGNLPAQKTDEFDDPWGQTMDDIIFIAHSEE